VVVQKSFSKRERRQLTGKTEQKGGKSKRCIKPLEVTHQKKVKEENLGNGELKRKKHSRCGQGHKFSEVRKDQKRKYFKRDLSTY